MWKYPKVWEGFIKCCQRTKPQSFQVILQLPPPQLGAVFDKCPELREPLLAHVRSFTPHQVPRRPGSPPAAAGGPRLRSPCLSLPLQQAHVPHSTMAILEASTKQEAEAKDVQPLEVSAGPRRAGTGPFLCPAPPAPAAPSLQEEPEPPALPRGPQDAIALRLAQEKALKRQAEEEQQKLKAAAAAAVGAAPRAPPAPTPALPPEEPMELREEGAEAEPPAIFISEDEGTGSAPTPARDATTAAPAKVRPQAPLGGRVGSGQASSRRPLPTPVLCPQEPKGKEAAGTSDGAAGKTGTLVPEEPPASAAEAPAEPEAKES